MSAWTIGLITFACVFGGALAGLYLRTVLAAHHVGDDTKDVVKVVTGLVATLSALVLGLLIASAKSSFDAVSDGFEQAAAKVIVIDRLLSRYGPEAKRAREELRGTYAMRLEQLLGPGGGTTLQDSAAIQQFTATLQGLAPANDAQRSIKARAEQMLADLAETRWLAFERAGSATPTAFLVVLVAWLAAMFLGFGLFSPRTPTAITALAAGALAVSTALFLIEEMGRPLDGLISVSAEPLGKALAVLGR